MDDDSPNIATLRHRAEEAPEGDERTEAWRVYRQKVRNEEARRDVLRGLYRNGARGLGARLASLPGVAVEGTDADDFGRAQIRLVVDGTVLWTRPILLDERAYKRARDAIAARRRGDHRRAHRRAHLWLVGQEPPRDWVRWDGIDKIRFGRNQYGYEPYAHGRGRRG